MRPRAWIGLALLSLALAACGEGPDANLSPEKPLAPTGVRGAVAAAEAFIAQQSIPRSNPRWKLNLPKPPVLEFDAKDTYTWVMETNQGTMKFKLRPDVAPMHVSSTIYLTRLGFYDGTRFHRVIQGFMAQGGDPLGVGRGGPGYQYDGEFSPSVRHDRAGLLSMANAGPGTDGSQFFLTFVETPWLDDKHTIFGELVEGEDVLKRLEELGQPKEARSHTPREPIVIERATIVVE